EPFATLAKDAGAREIYSPYAEPIEDLMIAGYFASTDIVEEDPELVDAFVAAMKESQQYAEDNPEEAKAILPEHSEIDPEIIDDLNMPKLPEDMSMEATERMKKLTEESGLRD